MDMPISVVILTYNRWNLLMGCLNSILRNTDHSNPEIIVVDNGSTDGTIELLPSLFPSIKLISLKGNQGGWCRNAGFETAQHSFIAQVDDDVIVKKHWDSILLRNLLDDKIGLTGPQGWIFKGWDRPNEGILGQPGTEVDFLTGYCWMMRNEPSFRYKEGFGFWHEDLDFSFCVKASGWKIMQSEPCCYHLAQRKNVDWKEHERGLDLVRKNWRDSIELKFVEFDQHEYLRIK